MGLPWAYAVMEGFRNAILLAIQRVLVYSARVMWTGRFSQATADLVLQYGESVS